MWRWRVLTRGTEPVHARTTGRMSAAQHAVAPIGGHDEPPERARWRNGRRGPHRTRAGTLVCRPAARTRRVHRHAWEARMVKFGSYQRFAVVALTVAATFAVA